MKKLLYSILIFILACSCGGEKSLKERAKELLEGGFFTEAEAIYENLKSKGGRDCEVLYGLFLSRSFEFIREAISGSFSLRSLGFGALFPTPYDHQPLKSLQGGTSANMDSIIENFVIPIDEFIINPLISSADEVIENNCNLYMEKGIEFLIRVVPEEKIWVGKDFRTSDAYFLRGIFHATKGILNYIASHNFNLNFADAFQFFENTGEVMRMTTNDIIGVLRLSAFFIDDEGEFLSFKEERKNRYSFFRKEISMSLMDFAEFLSSVFLNPDEENDERKDNIFSYVDANGSGSMDVGDEIYIGIISHWAESGKKFRIFGIEQDSFPIIIGTNPPFNLIFAIVDENYISNVVNFLEELSRIFLGQIIRGVELSEFNKLLPLEIDFFPEGISIHFHQLFPERVTDALPLRRLIPAWGIYDPPGDNGRKTGQSHKIFLIEGEVGKDAPPELILQEVSTNEPLLFCYTCPPGGHFKSYLYSSTSPYFSLSPEVSQFLQEKFSSSEVKEIPDDCVNPKRNIYEVTGFKIPLIYIYFQDPTFNNSLYINLNSFPATVKCDNDSNYQQWRLADNYTLNKILSYFLSSILSISSLYEDFFRNF